FHLLDPLATTTAPVDAVMLEEGDAVLNFLGGQLAHLLTERASAGLHRGYAEVEEVGPFLRGRLDVTAQLRDGLTRKDRLHCLADVLTSDVLCNRLPKATADGLLASPQLGSGV